MNNSEYLNELAARGDGSMQAWFDAEHADDCGHSADMSEKSADRVRSEPEMSEDDNREKLEADVLKHYTHTTSTLMWPDDANIKTKWISVSMGTVLEWLDRQAAITRDEVNHVAGIAAHEAGKILREQIDERNHLIAKARNSFKALSESNYDYAKFRKACRCATEIMDADMERMGIATDGRTLEGADEQTNGIGGETNGIAADAPLVDEQPEGDAVAILRKVAADKTDVSSDDLLRYAVGADMVPEAFDTLADMIERDYVGREEYEDLERANKRQARKIHNVCEANSKLKAECEEFERIVDMLTRQRDEWKTKCETREFAYKQADAERKRYGEQIDELTEEIAKRDKGIERLKRQRDEARAQLENLARDLAECSREREAYRRACGQLLDLADQMRLVRLDGCGAALADMDGEVVS